MDEAAVATRVRRLVIPAALLIAAVAVACGGGDESAPAATSTPRPIPSPVTFRQEPQGIELADPAFEALAGAIADFGRLGGAVYQIEVPDDWNGRLVLEMHGFEELRPEASVTAPDIRTYLILHGYAWGASSFSSTSSIPGRAADETAALWDYFTQKYGRPAWTYVTGFSMGGAAGHIAAERYPGRFDGVLALCGSAGQTPGAMTPVNQFVAGAYVAGVTQAEFDARTDTGALIRERILPALEDPAAHERWENIMIDVTGGPRAFDREGIHFEEETNWTRAQLLVAAELAENADTNYHLGPLSTISSEEYNRDVVRLRANDERMRIFTDGEDTTGDLQMPLLSLHTTGDGQVPIEQARILQRRVDAAGKSDLLVQRVFSDPGHCGFTTAEQEASFDDLVAWVEQGEKPQGEDALIDDLRALGGTFELTPRFGSREADAVPGAADRAVFRGNLTLDGAPFDARWLGANVRKDGLIAACQYTLPTVEDGRYEITVYAEEEVGGCGGPGAEVLLWTFAGDKTLYSGDWLPWPGNGGTASFDADFSTAAPEGARPPVFQFLGDVYSREGDHVPPGTRIEAYVGEVRCGAGSTRRTGNFSGYILTVVGPGSVAGCAAGATLTFRVDGQLAPETAVNDPLRGGDTLDLTLP